MLEQFKTENFISFLIVLWTFGNQNTLISKTYLTEQQKNYFSPVRFLTKKNLQLQYLYACFNRSI